LHGIGKFSPDFQRKNEEAWRAATAALLGEWGAPPLGVRHDVDGYGLRQLLRLKSLMSPACADWLRSDFDIVWQAVCGHHGAPVTEKDNSTISDEPDCLEAAQGFCCEVVALFGPFDAIPQPSAIALATVSWHLSGLTMVADWVGSNRAWFPYNGPDFSLSAYWRIARDKAEDAVAKAGLARSALAADLGPRRLFPNIATTLSPLQECVLDPNALPLTDGPVLAIIEDVTGAGKTEAALLLAARLMESGRADGLYFALPTMATANAMYDRLETAYRRLFAENAEKLPSLVLSHGKRHLNPAFSESILEAETTSAETYEDEGAAVCAAWIADDRRKAFLADIGVGTIDQALLSVLPSRHQAMRLFGLADKVLILDEAHAYDAYMGKEIETLLKFHAALGGSAIVLSATLPQQQRRRLAEAFQRGLGSARAALANDSAAAAYPLLTTVTRERQTSTEIATRKDRQRTLPVRRVSSFTDAIREVQAMAAKGAAVAWIRNAVDDAIEAAEALAKEGMAPTLLHARFAMGDRLDIEKEVCRRLGKNGSEADRCGFIVVGSQILEQSLDYDVDGMIVDLAPVDLVIQRAGRLWRHLDRRDRPLQAPELVVLSPPLEPVTDARWYAQISERAPYVYRHHGIVWRSAKALFETGAITTPDGVRGLVEAVYAPQDLDDVPEPLHKASRDSFGAERAAVSFAKASLLNIEKGYGGEMLMWESDQIVATRLGDPTTVFRLATHAGDKIVPWYADEVPARAWALSEVSLARRMADGVPKPDRRTAKMIEEAMSLWPKWERDIPVLVLTSADGDVWQGVVSLEGVSKDVLYDRRWGLRLTGS
jgi:CRISPR-associated endonuclease/helicase Cas3